jgi:histidine phosphotransferase ChpT
MTDYRIDLRVTELLCSRLCHDLISPISAINNGIELIAEVGEEARPDADMLIAESARNASRRLRAFRYAYGLAGLDVGINEMRDIAVSYFDGSKTAVNWPQLSIELPNGMAKVILNLFLMAPDLARGVATISLAASPGEVAVTYIGVNAKLDEDIIAALNGAVLPDNLDPRTAHAVLTAAQAARLNAKFSHVARDGEVTLKLRWAA